MSTAKKIVIIDDDTDLIETLTIILSGAEYAVSSATTGADGIALAEKESPDLIILDVMMTTIDEGFETARKMRESDQLREIPILMLSGVDKEFNFGFSDTAGSDYLPVNRFIEKPIEPKELLATVKELLG